MATVSPAVKAHEASEHGDLHAHGGRWADAIERYEEAAKLFREASTMSEDPSVRKPMEILATIQQKKIADVRYREVLRTDLQKMYELNRKEREDAARRARPVDYSSPAHIEQKAFTQSSTPDLESPAAEAGNDVEDVMTGLMEKFQTVMEGIYDKLFTKNLAIVRRPTVTRPSSMPEGSAKSMQDSYFIVPEKANPVRGTPVDTTPRTKILEEENTRLRTTCEELKKENESLKAGIGKFRQEMQNQASALRVDLAASVSRMHSSQMMTQSAMIDRAMLDHSGGNPDEPPTQNMKMRRVLEAQVASLRTQLRESKEVISAQKREIAQLNKQWEGLKAAAKKKRQEELRGGGDKQLDDQVTISPPPEEETSTATMAVSQMTHSRFSALPVRDLFGSTLDLPAAGQGMSKSMARLGPEQTRAADNRMLASGTRPGAAGLSTSVVAPADPRRPQNSGATLAFPGIPLGAVPATYTSPVKPMKKTPAAPATRAPVTEAPVGVPQMPPATTATLAPEPPTETTTTTAATTATVTAVRVTGPITVRESTSPGLAARLSSKSSTPAGPAPPSEERTPQLEPPFLPPPSGLLLDPAGPAPRPPFETLDNMDPGSPGNSPPTSTLQPPPSIASMMMSTATTAHDMFFSTQDLNGNE